MKVVSFDKDVYDVFDLVQRKVDTVHVARLYPFYYDPERVDPETFQYVTRANLSSKKSLTPLQTQHYRKLNGPLKFGGKDMMKDLMNGSIGAN